MRTDSRAREYLVEVVNAHGYDICYDASRCEALLLDCRPECRKDISALIAVILCRILDLDESPDICLIHAQEANLTESADEVPEGSELSPDLARWAVETWASAIGTFPWDDTSDDTIGNEVSYPTGSSISSGSGEVGRTARSASDVVSGLGSTEEESSSGLGDSSD